MKRKRNRIKIEFYGRSGVSEFSTELRKNLTQIYGLEFGEIREPDHIPPGIRPDSDLYFTATVIAEKGKIKEITGVMNRNYWDVKT